MKPLWKMNSHRRSLIALALALLAVVTAAAQKQGRVDPLTLDYATNLVVPEVPPKQAQAVAKHMHSIEEAIKHMGFDTESSRSGEVVTLLIPCSELFAPNDTVIKPAGSARLQNLSKLMLYPTMYKLVVSVYADDTGDQQYSDSLTSVRANAVEECLIKIAEAQNVSNPNIVPYGMGQSEPRAVNNSIANRALNRRVEIAIVPEYEMIQTAKSGKLNR